MKKPLALLLACCLLLSGVTGCKREPAAASSSEPPVSSEPAPDLRYTDGEYRVSYAVPALDRTLDYLVLKIADDAITVQDYGMKEDASAPSESASEAASEPETPIESDAEIDGIKVAEEILVEYEAVRGNLDKLAPLPGQEEHTYRFVRMMRTALRFAEAGDQNPVKLGKYADGEYRAQMPAPNENGWIEYVSLTVKDGLIEQITFDAVQGEDETKRITADPTANSAAQKPSDYYPEIARRFLDAGDNLSLVMSPSGGAAATKSFKKLMEALLVSMVSDGAREITAPRYVSGTYRAEFTEFDANGWKDYLVVRIDRDQISIREFDSIAKSDAEARKSQADEMIAQQEQKTGMTPQKALDALKESWSKAKNDVTLVDNVAGATVSANNFKLLLGQILATSALEGESEETLLVKRLESEQE